VYIAVDVTVNTSSIVPVVFTGSYGNIN